MSPSYNQQWSSQLSTNDPSRQPTTQQNGAPPPHQQPRSVDTVNSANNGQIPPAQLSPTSLTHSNAALHPYPTRNATSHNHIRGHPSQPPMVSPTIPRPPEDLTHSGLKQHSLASNHQQWALPASGAGGGHFPNLPGQPPIYNNVAPSGRRHVATNSPPDATRKKCLIPDCTYNAYYDVSEQEQSEYCGHGHQLQAVSSGLVASCVMCKERPRRTGERVCGRICRERERQAPLVQGSYYGEPVVRRTRPA